VSAIEGDDRVPAGDPVAAWIDPALRGDAAAMRALLAALAPVVMRAARRLLGRGHPDVDDVAQQTLVGVVERLPGFRGESSLAHFAERIAPHVNGQVGESERQDDLLRRHREAHRGHYCQSPATERTQRKERPRDKPDVHRAQQACEPDQGPESDERKAGAQP